MNTIEQWIDGKEHYKLDDGFELKKADNLEFGIHETIYSNMDLELNYSWKKQTENKLECESLFWIFKDDKRIGGVHICPNLCGAFFMESTYFVDRFLVINALNNALLQWSDKEKNTRIYGVIPSDIEHYHKLGYEIKYERRVMIRPTELFENIAWSDDYICRMPTISDVPELGKLFFESYSGGIQYEVFGQQSLEQATSDAEYIINIYRSNNILDGSTLVFDKKSNQLIAACIAGISGYCDNNFSEIGDIVVNPSYRKLGLASNMIKQALNNLKKISPAIILCVTIGNPAEDLYHKMGFFPGVKFANMYKK